ncbi:dihydroorotase [Pedobacter chitinilyticus]|uniref:Dihydroorotase n=1 Tax=Pedobacter chitinilyticus TaxID=2233776 RepID=A0A3S3STT2_9SPHI|nr:dihydroorotase [Pedobacter chitinilyticus]RWU10195.1 dihydroorotase [Pedobacter chitinilyticus]
MNLLIKGITIADPNSKFNGKTCDVSVENGIITAIASKLENLESAEVYHGKGAILSPGFFDLNCVFGDPGLETKEDISTGTAAAAAGGFTGIAIMPNTKPVVHSKGEVEYILNRAKGNLVDVKPIGAISQNLEGKELAEMFDMKQAGAVAFAEAGKAIADDGFMSRALQYALGFDGLLFTHPENKALVGKAQVNESKTTILLGMKGAPALAEELQVSRDIFLAQYHNAPLHISNISTAGSVALIKKAKKDGVKVTCDVAAHQLVFTEELLNDFDSNYKVKPPLRGKADNKALIAGLKDGTIDAISSQHRPHEIEFKNVEFEIAHYGIIALQTVLPLLLQAGLDTALIVEKLAIAPRNLLKLEVPQIAVGQAANFTAFNPTQEWQFDSETNQSKSANSPLFNTMLKGKVTLVYNNKQYRVF